MAVDSVTSTRASVLLFHRVLPEPDPMFPDLVDAARFDSLMRIVAASFKVVTLGEVSAGLTAGNLPSGALCITFDDGYADNAEIALPILQRYGLQATFFISSGFLDGGRMFNDSVIERVRRARGGSVDLGDFGLGLRRLDTWVQRRAAIDELLPAVKYLDLAERDAFIARLSMRLGGGELPRNLMMRAEQVVQLHRAGMEIGGHTVRHPILRVLPDADAEAEIAQGRDQLQALIDAPIDVFAYPNGRPLEDYDSRHVAMVKRLGFRAAVCTAPGAATIRSDKFQLPRFTPWDRGDLRWISRLLLARVSGAQSVVVN